MRIIHLTACALCLGFNLVLDSFAREEDDPSVFGHAEQSESALMGVMYDLKQTPARQPVTNPEAYYDVIDEFLAKNWDEAVLNRFYRVSRPMFTTQVFVPNMPADDAPKAFGAEKTVKPSQWIIHYKGQVSAPAPGTYRFWGSADDAIAVAVNGKTELVGCLDHNAGSKTWKPSAPYGAQASDSRLLPGDWFTVKSDDIVDLDVLIGEYPGGWFNAFLMIEKQGATYQKDGGGNPILPIFQVAPYDTPAVNDLGKEPLFAKGFPPWKCFQINLSRRRPDNFIAGISIPRLTWRISAPNSEAATRACRKAQPGRWAGWDGLFHRAHSAHPAFRS